MHLPLRENFLLSIKKKYSSTGQGHPLNEPYHVKHFLLQGNQFRQSTELAVEIQQEGHVGPQSIMGH